MSGARTIHRLASLFATRTGIDLERGNQAPSLARFVEQRTRDLGLPSFDAYVELLVGGESAELHRLINATTIGLSWLFRDAEQLAAVEQLFEELPDRERPLEIWVPGCARGEDVYSLAMLAAAHGRRVAILGSDINSDFIAEATEGVYGAWSCRHVPARLAHHLVDRGGGRHAVAPSLRRGLRFARHNLLDAPPPPAQAPAWDVVLCRNVLIYFHAAEAAATVARLAGALRDDGWLFLGANEPWSPAELRPVSLSGRVAFRRGSAAPIPSLPLDATLPDLAPPPAWLTEAEAAPAPAPAEPAAAPGPLSPEVSELFRAAAARHVEGRFAEALTLYSQVLAVAPLLNEAHLLLGVTHYMMGDHAAAVQALRAALFLDPDLWPAAFYLALSHDRLGNRGQAVRAYRHVVAAANKPQRFSTIVLDQLGVWKADIVELARGRAAEPR